ncbi:GntR family transcriptional regulator [Streptomyces zaomyceticus]|uniref:GntR family transcriptional regulator n=1 Tax=Streptomyces zaomyceticus TaxID=68286 RepID=UPI001675AFDE|nr:GntR family transcriptional regulator [Streptomyces zaomyceticus]GHG29828.1 hypothetical protein GCM10018791_52800 [Streptomyces zaomyceticus]
MSQASARGTYLIVAAALRLAIESGEGSSALPSEADLMRQFGIARNTVRRALKILEAEGRVESAPGIGWRIAQGGDRQSLAARVTSVISEDALTVGDPFPSEARLCERFSVSRTAVRRVLAQMEGNGLLNTVQGRGRTVRALPDSEGQS